MIAHLKQKFHTGNHDESRSDELVETHDTGILSPPRMNAPEAHRYARGVQECRDGLYPPRADLRPSAGGDRPSLRPWWDKETPPLRVPFHGKMPENTFFCHSRPPEADKLRRESSLCKVSWTPASAGVTTYGTFQECIKVDELVRRQKGHFSVIPAKAGIQVFQGLLDLGFRRGDGLECLLRLHQGLI